MRADSMRVAAIVPAAGKGKRIKSKIEKPFIEICGKPVIAHTLLRLSQNKHINETIVAVRKKNIKNLRRIIKKFKIEKTAVVVGGAERKDSVFNALKKVSPEIDYVLIHDGIRPFITDRLINNSLRAAQRFKASVVCVPVKPTLKFLDKRNFIQYTPQRTFFWEAQTPQVFEKTLIERAYKIYSRKSKITDDSMLAEQLGVKPKVVMGSYSNIKITTQEDLELARMLFKRRA